MLKRDELKDENSCLNRAHEAEPLFVLRANDENAPSAVAAWARDYVQSKGGWNAMTDQQKKKYTEAMDIASSMRIWKMQQHKRRAQS